MMNADPEPLPAGFVRVADYLPDVVLDIRYYGDNNFMQAPAVGYEASQAILSQPAAIALQKVQDYLAVYQLGIKIFDAYRPQQAVDHFLRWADEPEDSAITARFHPGLSKPQLFELGYLAARSSHTRGSTLDMTLVALEGNSTIELDMGTEFDFFGAASAAAYLELTPTQRANRLLLRSVMEQYGFVGFAMEWWHFTLRQEPYPNQYFDFPVS